MCVKHFFVSYHIIYSFKNNCEKTQSKNNLRLKIIRLIVSSQYSRCVYICLVDVFIKHSHNLPNSQLSRLQHIQNSLARAVVKTPKFSHITPTLKSLHGLKVNERIEYKILSLTYKTLSTAQPAYLHNLISLQSPGRTRSSSLITITRPPSSSSLKITNRSFRYASPSLWNDLPASFRQPQAHSSSVTNIAPSITSSLFHSRLKTHLFHKSFPP